MSPQDTAHKTAIYNTKHNTIVQMQQKKHKHEKKKQTYKTHKYTNKTKKFRNQHTQTKYTNTRRKQKIETKRNTQTQL